MLKSLKSLRFETFQDSLWFVALGAAPKRVAGIAVVRSAKERLFRGAKGETCFGAAAERLLASELRGSVQKGSGTVD